MRQNLAVFGFYAAFALLLVGVVAIGLETGFYAAVSRAYPGQIELSLTIVVGMLLLAVRARHAAE